MLSYHRLWS